MTLDEVLAVLNQHFASAQELMRQQAEAEAAAAEARFDAVVTQLANGG